MNSGSNPAKLLPLLFFPSAGAKRQSPATKQKYKKKQPPSDPPWVNRAVRCAPCWSALLLYFLCLRSACQAPIPQGLALIRLFVWACGLVLGPIFSTAPFCLRHQCSWVGKNQRVITKVPFFFFFPLRLVLFSPFPAPRAFPRLGGIFAIRFAVLLMFTFSSGHGKNFPPPLDPSPPAAALLLFAVFTVSGRPALLAFGPFNALYRDASKYLDITFNIVQF